MLQLLTILSSCSTSANLPGTHPDGTPSAVTPNHGGPVQTSSTSCAHCQGVNIQWRVKRIRGAGPASRRTLVWTCQGCGAVREEPLSPGPELPLPGPA